MKTRVLFTVRRALRRGLLLLLPALLGPLAARAQNVGIGTTSPTQKLDVDGSLRLRGLSGSGLRLPQVQPDGTLTVGSSSLLSSTANVAVPLTTLAMGTASDRVFRPVLADGLLYVPSDFQLRIFDVHTPTAPVARGVISLPGAFQATVTVVNGRRLAVVVDLGNNAFYVVDVSNPAAPSLVSSTSNANDDGAPAAILSQDNIIYISSAADTSPALARLAIWDLANPAAPVRRSSVAVGTTARLALSAADNLLYVADNQNNVLRILNVANPAAPAVLSATPLGTGADGLAVSGPTLYAAGAGMLSAYDVSTPAAPRLLASVPAASGDLAVAGSVGLLTDAGAHKLQSFDLSNPAAPVLRGAVLAPSQDVNAPDEYPAYVATDGTTGYVSIDFGARVEAFGLGGTPRVVVVGTDGSLGSVPAQAQITPSLSLNGQTLSIGGGNSVTLPGDNLGNHLATQNLSLASYQLVGNGGTMGLNVSSTGNVGIGLGTGAAASRLHVYNASSFDVARLESGSVGPHLQFIKTNAGQAIVDYIGTDYTGFRAGALELRGGTSVQLSGDGDPSSPDLVVAATGNVGIGTGTTAPATRLDVNGVARATAVRTPATGAHNLLPAAYGSVGSGPSVFGSTDNFTVGRVPGVAAGAYRLTFSGSLSTTSLSAAAVTTTLFGTAPGLISYTVGTGTLDVYTFNTAAAPADRGFSFSLFLP